MTASRRRRIGRAVLALLFAAAAGSVGCDALLGLTDKDLRADAADASMAPDAEGAQDAPHDLPDAAPDALPASCAELGVPARPPADPSADAADPEQTLVLAFRSVDFEDRVRGAPNDTVGLNLDRVCTCPGPESCRPRLADAGHCDLDGAIDNVGASLLTLYSRVHDTPLDDLVNQQIALGEFTVLLRIARYNGKANDPSVTFSFFTSSGTPHLDGGARAAPAFDGHDTWEIDPTSALASTDGGADDASDGAAIPKYQVYDAYVADHVLVASLGDFPIPFGAGAGIGVGLRFNMKLSGVVVTATLRPDDAGGFSVDDGLLAGRWATQSILFALGSLPDQIYGGKVCDNPDSYNALRTLVCNAADIASDPAHDRVDPAWGCDAVSVGMKFRGGAAMLGNLGTGADVGSPCDHGQGDDCR